MWWETKQYLWFPMMPRRARCPEGPRMAPQHGLCVHRVLCILYMLPAFIMTRYKKNQGQRRKLFTQGSLASEWGARIQAHASCLPSCTPYSQLKREGVTPKCPVLGWAYSMPQAGFLQGRVTHRESGEDIRLWFTVGFWFATRSDGFSVYLSR